MKIIGGKFRGMNFYMPAGIRPTQNITRKALFDLLGRDWEGVELLDLFAGSGAVGLEALSHGAKKVTFVEKDSRCVSVIGENIQLLLAKHQSYKGLVRLNYEVLEADGLGSIKQFLKAGKKFDIVFVDPPYRLGLAKKALKLLGGYDILHPNCWLVIQHEIDEKLPDSEGRFNLYKRRSYGNSVLSIYSEQKNLE